MKKLKLTRWFPGNIKPIRIGIYQRSYPTGIYYSQWNGESWGIGFANISIAKAQSFYKSNLQELHWRGVRK